MKVIFNNLEIEVYQAITIYAFLQSKAVVDKSGIAVAVNGMIIPKSKWNETILKQGDNILLITATAGG
jgi:sulfur carrier protein